MSSNFKKAIIIGGSKGLGKQISQNIKSLGIKTYACSRKEIDTSDLTSVKKFIKKHKSTDILVLNSGGPPPLKFSKISEPKFFFIQYSSSRKFYNDRG